MTYAFSRRVGETVVDDVPDATECIGCLVVLLQRSCFKVLLSGEGVNKYLKQ